ncbi:MAG: hypothetical protein H7249_04730 [Chitinophagaceae bacterium]|nr:hypothetical protein [Oligoflexus sp.]
MKNSLVALAALGFLLLLRPSPAQAAPQVQSEAELFGAPAAPKVDVKKETKDQPTNPRTESEMQKSPVNEGIDAARQKQTEEKPAVVDRYASELIDKMQIGGRLELRGQSNKVDDQRYQQSPYNQNKTADIYFDTRPNKDTRAFLRLRFYEDNSARAQSQPQSQETVTSTEKTGVSSIEESIDELWLKWDIEDTVFVTAGKQHVKWGRGRFWNPTDFTATEAKDPFALFDRRLGQEMIKIHLPFEKSGHNLYAIAELDDTHRNDDVGLALRGEFSVGSNGETAISLYSKRGKPLKLGLDLGIGFGNFDINTETAFLTRDDTPRYEGDLDIAKLQVPTAQFDHKNVYNQSVLNIEYIWKYNDDDNVTFGLEGFWNGLGYDTRTLEFYSLLQNQSKILYAGKQYIAGYARLPTPGDWNETTFIFNAVQNLSDNTVLTRLTATYLFYKQITAEAYISRCFGDYGELCFRVPEKIVQGAPAFPASTQAIIAALPKKTTRTVFGGSLSMNF